jgi:hypothetical protein
VRRAPVVQAQVPVTQEVKKFYYIIFEKNIFIFPKNMFIFRKNLFIFYFYFTGASDEGGPKVLLRRPHRARAQERQRGLRRYGNAHGDRPKP